MPRLGWIEAPSPITTLAGPNGSPASGWLGVKRDDSIPAIFGGSKARKLDTLLAHAPWCHAPALGAAGAVGSGHLVAMTAASERLGRRAHAETFWSPVTAHALENLSYVATRAQLRYHPTRVHLALRQPEAVGARQRGEIAWMPPGGSAVEGLLGLVRAGFELADQVAAGALPRPDHIVVALGSGGIAAGLAVGLGMAGLRPTLHAVSVVERLSLPRLRLWRLVQTLRRWLEDRGVPVPEPAPIEVDHGQLGPGYGHPTAASWAAVATLLANGVPGEPAYTGKAWAALEPLSRRMAGQSVLFWSSARRGPLPVAERWREALPPALAARLEQTPVLVGDSTADLAEPPVLTRRRLLWSGAALAVSVATLGRLSGYRAFPAWDGVVLAAWEAEVLRAAAEAVLPPAPLPQPLLDEIPRRADRFLASLPERARLEVHGMFALIEHGTPLGRSISRFTRLDVAGRLAFLTRLSSTHLGHAAAKGVRDLALVGYYQDPSTWSAIGYGGPRIAPARPRSAQWDRWIAAPGALPRSAA